MKSQFGSTVMATGQLQNVLKHLRRVLAHRRESVASDGELL
jgi:hypothetical protein